MLFLGLVMDAEYIAQSLAGQVERWYDGGKIKRDKIVGRLRDIGEDEIADDIIRWYEMGDKRFFSLIERLRDFKAS